MKKQFKVGDWVRTETGIRRIVDISERLSEISLYVAIRDKQEPWQPKEGEWCWFYNKQDYVPTIGKLSRHSIEENLYFCFNGVVDYSYEYCEPFIGELPTIIKG